MSKCMIIIDINNEDVKNYDHFRIDYNLKAKNKNNDVICSLEFVEDYPVILMGDEIKEDIKGLFYE